MKDCENSIWIKLRMYAIKLCEKVLGKRVRERTKIYM